MTRAALQAQTAKQHASLNCGDFLVQIDKRAVKSAGIDFVQ